MFRQIIVYLLILTTFTANFSRFFIFAGFELNQKYIAATLCINKSRPWLHCNGKCYLTKKIRQVDEKEKKPETKDNLNRLEVSFFQELLRISPIEQAVIKLEKKSFPIHSYQYCNRYIETIFRPPRHIA